MVVKTAGPKPISTEDAREILLEVKGEVGAYCKYDRFMSHTQTDISDGERFLDAQTYARQLIAEKITSRISDRDFREKAADLLRDNLKHAREDIKLFSESEVKWLKQSLEAVVEEARKKEMGTDAMANAVTAMYAIIEMVSEQA